MGEACEKNGETHNCTAVKNPGVCEATPSSFFIRPFAKPTWHCGIHHINKCNQNNCCPLLLLVVE